MTHSCVMTLPGAVRVIVVAQVFEPVCAVQGLGEAERVAVGMMVGDGSVLDCHAEPVHLYHWLYEFFVNIFPL